MFNIYCLSLRILNSLCRRIMTIPINCTLNIVHNSQTAKYFVCLELWGSESSPCSTKHKHTWVPRIGMNGATLPLLLHAFMGCTVHSVDISILWVPRIRMNGNTLPLPLHAFTGCTVHSVDIRTAVFSDVKLALQVIITKLQEVKICTTGRWTA